MALLWLDSFDHYATADLGAKYGAFGGSGGITAGAGRRASGALVLPSSSLTAVTLNPANNTVVVGVAFKTTLLSSVPIMVHVRSGGAAQLTVQYNASGFMQVWRGLGATLLGTAVVAPISANAFYYLELKAVIHPSAGSAIVRLNEAEVLNLSGVNTSGVGTAVWDSVAMNSTSGVSVTFDDLYILDGAGPAPLNNFLGDCRVDARFPTAEGASSAWTPLSGTDNALMVDDPTPDGDTTYNTATTINLTDTHVVQDAPVPGAVLYGVQLSIDMKKSDAGTCSVAPVVRHAGTDFPGTAVNPGTSYTYAVIPYGTNPGTGLAWTEADFNNAEFGVKRTA